MKSYVYIILIILLLPVCLLGKVHLNEVYYKIPDYSGWNKNDQWIEILNFSSDQISLNGWKLEDKNGNIFTFSISLSPHQRIILVADSSRFASHWDSILIPSVIIIEYNVSIDINSEVGELSLLNSNGDIISNVKWGGTGTSTGVPSGYSLGLFPEGVLSPQPGDYITCTPTPGRENREAPASAVNPATWGRIKAMFSAGRDL